MKHLILPVFLVCVLFSCKEGAKASMSDIKEGTSEVKEEQVDSIIEVVEEPIKKTTKQIKEELIAKGFKVFDFVDNKTQDTIIMQQYFMAFLKTGPIRGQNEEETALLQEEHLAHLTKMYDLGYADISGPFGDDGDIRGVTVYNVPTLKMADSLANSDPMVKAGRLEIEIHPWWAGKGFPLR
ncbi:hypothetical protein Q4Q39_06215 [Flavivirga amylovorans]|uniref:YCII-related domain-containing protein n=1 Tax=Flavivirga amylovorans TaxID=870486 RepID=A0ABT8WZ91_9FLAO|nr:YciI family protein [Flavivirga amylovorans]MDO5986999.1 hypothetical protein [Flavivirga amylovorans]